MNISDNITFKLRPLKLLAVHIDHSHANLKSKLLREIAYDWKILNGKAQSMLNASLPTLPNYMYILLSSYSSIN